MLGYGVQVHPHRQARALPPVWQQSSGDSVQHRGVPAGSGQVKEQDRLGEEGGLF